MIILKKIKHIKSKVLEISNTYKKNKTRTDC